jgi:hypothetical protein
MASGVLPRLQQRVARVHLEVTSMATRVWISTAVLTLTLATTAAAQAQGGAQPPTSGGSTAAAASTTATPTFEVGLGYQWLRSGEVCTNDTLEVCSGSLTYPLGFAVDGVRNFGHLGVVGEVGWSRHAEDVTRSNSRGTDSENIFHYAAGVRWTGHNAARFWPYGQILLGGATVHTAISYDDDILDNTLGTSDTTTRFILQPGVGVTVVVGDGWGVFGQVDYRRMFLDENDDGSSGRNDVRVFAGIRFILD